MDFKLFGFGPHDSGKNKSLVALLGSSPQSEVSLRESGLPSDPQASSTCVFVLVVEGRASHFWESTYFDSRSLNWILHQRNHPLANSGVQPGFMRQQGT